MDSKIDIEFYRNFYSDLNTLTEDELISHYNNHGESEGRLCSLNSFLNKYAGFDIIFYRFVNSDLNDLDDFELLKHYDKYGRFENRAICEKYENIDIEFYKSMYNDLSDLNDIEILKHYNESGKSENRLTSIEDFYNKNPEFDINFYRLFNSDLISLTDIELFKHYNYYGILENRVYCIKQFYDKHTDFDINFYRLFNKDLEGFSDIELLIHHNEYWKNENRVFSKETFHNNFSYFDINNIKENNPHLNDLELYKYYYNKIRFEDKNEKIYNKNMNIQYIVDYLLNNNIKILVCNGDYDEGSGGITILHYFCHLINYLAKTTISHIINIKWKSIDDYNDDDFRIKSCSYYLTPPATKEILLTRNNIVIYMDSIKGNPLEQKYVVRWILYFEMGNNMKSWDKDDLILWYCDLYRKYTKNVQKFNNDIVISDISNNQGIFSILSNISKLLNVNNINNTNNKLNECCYTIRKIGKTISSNNGNRLLSKPNYDYNNECTNCELKKWPTECTCKDYVDGIKIIHDNKNYNKVYRFEYPTKLVDEIELFKNTRTFYCYDPFCFSAVIAVLHNCLTVIPKLELFGNENIYENVPWVQYGISYGNDEESINNALNTLPFTKILLRNLFYNINYDYMKVFFESIYNHFFKKNFITNIIENIKPKKVVMLIYMNNYGYELKSLLETNIIFKNYFEIIISNSLEDDKDIDILVYDKENNVFVPEYVQKILLNTEEVNIINFCNEIVNSLHININFNKTIL